MAYNTFGNQGSTLTQDEMNAEAERILTNSFEQIPDSLGENAVSFLKRKKAEFIRRRHVIVSVKELFWLRDLAARDY